MFIIPTGIRNDLTVFGVALSASLLLTIPVRRFALHVGMVDQPGPRKVHLLPIPLLGGLAIYLGFVFAVALALHAASERQIMGILAGATLVAVVGFLDDRKLLHHQVKLFVGMPLAGIFLLASGVRAQIFVAFFPGWRGNLLDACFTLFWVVGITAAFSILDHMDGLCAGVASVAAAFFAISAALNRQSMVQTLAVAAFGAALGFLWWNFNPAKIFMGDSGAMLLGFLMAALGLEIRPLDDPFHVSWFVPILILGVPIFDTALVSFSRARRGLLPFASPGKDHTAHRLSNLGLGHRGAVLALYGLGVLFGISALLVPRLPVVLAYGFAGAVLVCGLIAIRLLESAPYERQPKLQNTAPPA